MMIVVAFIAFIDIIVSIDSIVFIDIIVGARFDGRALRANGARGAIGSRVSS